MYDREWARDVVTNYQKLCARAQQIDMCIQQMYKQRYDRDCTRHDIQVVLIDSVQGKLTPRYWREYKRLVKRTPLDKDLLEMVCNTIGAKIDVEKLQRQFEWD